MINFFVLVFHNANFVFDVLCHTSVLSRLLSGSTYLTFERDAPVPGVRDKKAAHVHPVREQIACSTEVEDCMCFGVSSCRKDLYDWLLGLFLLMSNSC